MLNRTAKHKIYGYIKNYKSSLDAHIKMLESDRFDFWEQADETYFLELLKQQKEIEIILNKIKRWE